jgi:hypothetical protein
MEIKPSVIFEIKKDDKLFQFIVPEGTNVGMAYAAAHELLLKFIELAKEAADRAKPQEEPKAKE